MRRLRVLLAIALGAGAGQLAAQVEVSFPTPDGGVVYADLYGRGEHAVVLAHGGRFTRGSWAPQARVLADSGFRVLAIDFRGRGRSRGGPVTDSSDMGERFDVMGAVQYLHLAGAARVSVVGASFGGGAAAEAAIALSAGEIERLVLLAHTPVAHPERLPGRKLFIVARGDTTASGVPRLVAIRRQYEAAPPPRELLVLEGTAHAQFLFDTPEGPRLLREILRFLRAP
ncbi:MAG: alpha/beta fold hydrolase [Gemmatimonadota bacterium]|nr:alpha/beta fold hydrolase [Gemmatimonadota bacterium]